MQKIDESNRMGKTRDIFKKIRDIKGIFHAKMNTIKDRNGMELTEAGGFPCGSADKESVCNAVDLHSIPGLG